MEAAKSLEYQLVKREAPRGWKSAETVIGIVVDEISTDPWMALAIDGAREKAWEFGLTLSVSITRGDTEIENAVMEQMASQPLLGMIYGTIQTRQVKLSPALQRIPTVLLNCHVADRSLPSVVPSEVVGGRTATERLILAGHNRIAMIEGEVGMEASRDRFKGYRQALASHEIPFDPQLVRPGNWEPSAGFEQTVALMHLPKPPTAIFCANDVMAAGCYEALKEMGKTIPGDVAVIGYDDRETAQFARPPLTTILLPHYEMGMLAAEYLIDRSAVTQAKPPQIKVECPLVERSSVGPVMNLPA